RGGHSPGIHRTDPPGADTGTGAQPDAGRGGALHGPRAGLRLRRRFQVRGPRREPLPVGREPRPDGAGRPAADLDLRGAAPAGRASLSGALPDGTRGAAGTGERVAPLPPAGRSLPARVVSASITARSSSGKGALMLSVTCRS